MFRTSSHCDIHYFKANVPTYKNQSIDLHCKTSDWFLYGNNIDLE